MNLAQIISETILGQDVTIEECEILSTAVTQKTLAQGDILFDEGTKDETLYLLKTGKLEVELMKKTGV